MHQTLQDLTDTIEQAASSLRRRYSARQLYAMRVGMRRIRSILKKSGSHRARRFRKTWGGFAAVTNTARDWDVFMTVARQLLPAEAYDRFRRGSRKRIAANRAVVREMLGSGHWRQNLAEWRAYVERIGEAPVSGGGQTASDQALDKARTTLATARDGNDDRAWHKFRIAVKEVRYLADAEAERGGADEQLSTLIENCKMLQTLLGEWHDSVVQLQLLEDLPKNAEHEALRRAIARRRRDQLAAIRAAVSEQVFATPAKRRAPPPAAGR